MSHFFEKKVSVFFSKNGIVRYTLTKNIDHSENLKPSIILIT